MPLFPIVLLHFLVTALRANGTGIIGAQVRVLDPEGIDVTPILFLDGTPSITDANGTVDKTFFLAGILTPGIYTIQVIAAGFDLWSFTTDNTFTGVGTFTANLTRPATLTSYDVNEPPTGPLSSMVPIVCKVHSPNDFPWEQINATVTHPTNASSTIQAPVDQTTDLATLDLRNRVQLGIRPLLVGDAVISREDTEFSTPIAVTFSSLNPEGETAIEETFTRLVAATLPPDSETNLSAYTSTTARKWIVPSEPVIVFRGYYRDVMVWLPGNSENVYELFITYYDGAGQVVASPTLTLTESDYVQRIRLDTDPVAHVAKSVLLIKLNGVAVTNPLTVLYRD